VSIGDALQNIWNGILHVTSLFVIPDWGALVQLLPVFLVLGVLGPILSLGLLVWVIYFLRKPRVPLPQEAGPVRSPIGADGQPIVPRGEPFCYRDALIYPPNASRCGICGDELDVKCPKCEVVRPAQIDTCGNCGLVLKLNPQPRIPRRATPPPGGAALA
jgi:hypothetical protein